LAISVERGFTAGNEIKENQFPDALELKIMKNWSTGLRIFVFSTFTTEQKACTT